MLQELEPIVEAHEPKRQKSLRCILKGHALTEEEIAEARKEIGGMTEKIPKRVVQLGGLWEDVPFDVSNKDIRQMRREFSDGTKRRTEKL